MENTQHTPKLLGLFFICYSLLAVSSLVQAEAIKPGQTVTQDVKDQASESDSKLLTEQQKDLLAIKEPHSKAFKTLFLTAKQRHLIDRQRLEYLEPEAIEKQANLVIPKKSDKPKKKRIYIPPKVEISAVIVKPDGSTIIRVNNKFDKSPSKHIQIDQTQANVYGVPITVQGKTRVVPVGTTLMTRQGKLVDSYKLQQRVGQKQLPKTEQKAVKQTLEQVKILNAKPQQTENLPPKSNSSTDNKNTAQ